MIYLPLVDAVGLLVWRVLNGGRGYLVMWRKHRLLQTVPGVKRPGRGVDHPPPSSAEVKERLEHWAFRQLWDYLLPDRSAGDFIVHVAKSLPLIIAKNN